MMIEKIFPRNNPETFDEIRARHPRKDLKGLRVVPTMTHEQKVELIEYLRKEDEFRARSLSFNGMKVIR